MARAYILVFLRQFKIYFIMFEQFISFFKRKILRDNQVRWNYKYAKGDWEGLKNPALNNRLLPAIHYIKSLKPQADILEIGCGEGVFQQMLGVDNYQSFEGTDISDWAINQAQAFANAQTVFIAADMEIYLPQKPKYDVIVITDSVYYSAKPLQLLKRYQSYLQPDGIFIITMNAYKHSDKVWQKIEEHYRPRYQEVVANTFGKWTCKVYPLQN